MEAGIDSLAATALSSRLRSVTGVVLSPTLVFEQPTPRAVAAHIVEQLTDCDALAAGAAAAPAGCTAPRSLGGAIGVASHGCLHSVAHAQCGTSAFGVLLARWVLEASEDASVLRAAQVGCMQHGGFVPSAQRLGARACGVSLDETGAMGRPRG